MPIVGIWNLLSESVDSKAYEIEAKIKAQYPK